MTFCYGVSIGERFFAFPGMPVSYCLKSDRCRSQRSLIDWRAIPLVAALDDPVLIKKTEPESLTKANLGIQFRSSGCPPERSIG